MGHMRRVVALGKRARAMRAGAAAVAECLAAWWTRHAAHVWSRWRTGVAAALGEALCARVLDRAGRRWHGALTRVWVLLARRYRRHFSCLRRADQLAASVAARRVQACVRWWHADAVASARAEWAAGAAARHYCSSPSGRVGTLRRCLRSMRLHVRMGGMSRARDRGRAGRAVRAWHTHAARCAHARTLAHSHATQVVRVRLVERVLRYRYYYC
jgi:hypothetical protein